MGIKFDKDPLAVEQNNCLTKIVNLYIVYVLDAWPKVPLRNFTLKICLFGATNIVKNSDKEKDVHSDYRISFDGKVERRCGNDYARNVIIFGIDNSSSSHADNLKNSFLILAEGDTFGINGSFGAPAKQFSMNFSKIDIKFCLSLHYNVENSYLFVNGKEILKFLANNKMLIFQLDFV